MKEKQNGLSKDNNSTIGQNQRDKKKKTQKKIKK